MAIHHFTLLGNGHLNIAQYLQRGTLPSCEDNGTLVTARTMEGHHLLVAMVTSTLPSTSSERNTVIHHQSNVVYR